MDKQRRVDRAWAEYSEDFRKRAFPKLMSSAVSLTIYSGGSSLDVRQATELGATLLLDKPLIIVSRPGSVIPSRLRRAADVVIENWTADKIEDQERLDAALRHVTEQP